MLKWQVVYDLYLTRAARATKVAYDSGKQKSHRLNRPICIMKPAGTKKKSEYPIGIESLCPSAQRWDVLTIELLGDLSVEPGHIYLVHYDTRPAYC